MQLFRNIFIFLILIVTKQFGYGQINANFSANDSIACNTLIVQFTNNSQGTGTMSYSWDFGNGITSTLTNPQVVFNKVGSYSVTLIASNQTDSDTLSKTNYIVIHKSPVISNILVGSNTGCVPFLTDFESVVEIGDAPFEEFIWDFGDGNSSAQEKPTHTFQKGGVFDVTLFVKDTNNCESNYTKAELVKAVTLPIVTFTSTQNVACIDSLTVSFNNTSYGESLLTYNWDFGNGNTSTEVSPEVFYSGLNNYTVILEATDTYGCTNSLIKDDYVRMQEIIIDINFIDDYLCKKEDVQINNNTVGANRHYWEFGDNTTSNNAIPIKNYVDTGLFEIIYIAALDNDCSDTLKHEIYVDPVTAKFSTDQNYGCQFPFKVEYSDSSSNADKWHWIFGNSDQSFEKNPTTEYSITSVLEEYRNIYLNDTLIVESEQHCFDTAVIDSNIHLHLPTVYFTPNDSVIYQTKLKGCIPIQVNFESNIQNYFDEDPVVNLTWDFGDATISSLENPDHDYNIAGEYPISLSITNQSGCVNSYKSLLLAGTPQQAKFSYSGASEICGSELLTFSNESTIDSLVDAWKWEFSEGSKIATKNPEILLSDTGFISGILTVSYNGCEGSTYELTDFVYIKGPAGDYHLSLNCNDPLNYYFENNIKGASTWYYDFGDGIYDSTLVENVGHKYPGTGNYTSFIEAKNSDESCTLRKEKKIFARQLEANFSFLPETICSRDTVEFNPLATIDNTFFINNNKLGKYLWNFGDESDTEFVFGSSKHVFEKAGSYNVNLVVRDANGCEQQLQKWVKVYGVNSGFTYSDSIGCAPIDVSFYDTSTSDTTLEKWIWNFGNQVVDTNQNTSQTFLEDTSYSVMFIVSDVLGCTDTLIKQNAIHSSNPTSNFQAVKTNNCFNDSIQFLNISEGSNINSYLWDFGNGITSDEFEPRIPYTDTGYFDISLLVTDSLGCDSQLVKSNYIYIQPDPISNFSLNSISAACYPKVIGFTDISISNDITYRLWNFGDNEESENVENPYHTYRKPGVFDVSLKVTTSLGCTNTLSKNSAVTIGGPYAEVLAPDTACVNTPINISFNKALNINNFQWTLDDGSIYNTDSFEKLYTSFGVKKMYLSLESDTLGTCSKLIIDSINLPTLIADFELTDYALCAPFSALTLNKSTNINASEWFEGSTFLSNDTNTEIKISEPGLHTIKLVAINKAACRDSISKEVTVYALPYINLNSDTLICQFDTIALQAYNGINYWWYNENKIIDSLHSNILVAPEENSYYSVKVIDLNSCVNYDSVNVEVQPKPYIQIVTLDTTLIIGERIDLIGQQKNADEISWQPHDYLSCITCETTTSQPMQNVTYYFVGRDKNNCFLISDSIHIAVDAKYSVDVPNSFTPNGDGINDFLFVMGWGIKELRNFTIYDLNGRVIFQTNDISEGWDGNSRLGMQGEGMYIYEVNVVSFDNIDRRKQGYVYLLK